MFNLKPSTISRWTPICILFPHSYLELDAPWWRFDIEDYNERYEWEQDQWNGIRDFVSQPTDTWMSEAGDCEDYSILIASYLMSETDKSVALGWLYDGFSTHVVCYTNNKVFDSGHVHNVGLDKWVEQSSYQKLLTRSIRE